MAGWSQKNNVEGSEILNSLKSAVQNLEDLAWKNDGLKKEIELKNKEIEMLQGKFEIEASERIKLQKEFELREEKEDYYQKEITELKRKICEVEELNSRLREERHELCLTLKEKDDDFEEIIKLKKKIFELKIEKLEAKIDMDVYFRRFKKSEERLLIMNVENDASAKRKALESFAALSKTNETNVNPSDSSSPWERAAKRYALESFESFEKHEALWNTYVNASDSSSEWERAKKRRALESLESSAERDKLWKTNVYPSDSSSQWERTGGDSKACTRSSKTNADVYQTGFKELEGEVMIMNVEKDASTAETNSGIKQTEEASLAFRHVHERVLTDIQKEHPANTSVNAVGIAGGHKWKAFSEAEKAPFVAMAEKRKVEYEKKMIAYNKEQDEEEEEFDKSESEVNDDEDGDDEEDSEDEDDDE